MKELAGKRELPRTHEELVARAPGLYEGIVSALGGALHGINQGGGRPHMLTQAEVTTYHKQNPGDYRRKAMWDEATATKQVAQTSEEVLTAWENRSQKD